MGGVFEGDAHAYLMSVYKDPSKPENVRIDAAKAALRSHSGNLYATALKRSNCIASRSRSGAGTGEIQLNCSLAVLEWRVK